MSADDITKKKSNLSFFKAPIAQRLEHRSYKAGVDGSIPSRRTNVDYLIAGF